MKNLKTLGGALALSVAMFASVPVQASGIPVFDGSNIVQTILQLEEQRKQLKSMTGNARLAYLLNDATVQSTANKFLPKGVKLSDLVNGRYDNVAKGLAQQLEAQERRNGSLTIPEAKTKLLATKAMANEAYSRIDNELKTMIQQIQQESGRVMNMAPDASGKADAQNALLAQQSQMNIRLKAFDVQLRAVERAEKEAQKTLENSVRKYQRAKQKIEREKESKQLKSILFGG